LAALKCAQFDETDIHLDIGRKTFASGLLLESRNMLFACCVILASRRCFKQVNQSQQLIELGLYNAEFGREGIGLVGQDLEIPSDPSTIAQVRESRGILRGWEQEFFLSAKFSRFTIRNQRVGRAPECALNGLPAKKAATN
jgi:hypothetical protein